MVASLVVVLEGNNIVQDKGNIKVMNSIEGELRCKIKVDPIFM